MPLETATYIDSLVTSNPTGSDSRTTADDHLRLIKAALLRTFTGVTGPVTGTQTTLNRTNDLTSSAQLQIDALKTGPQPQSRANKMMETREAGLEIDGREVCFVTDGKIFIGLY